MSDPKLRLDLTGDSGWIYIDECPHGKQSGAIPVTTDPAKVTSAPPVWLVTFGSLPMGILNLSPSVLQYDFHGPGQDCHWGPGNFPYTIAREDPAPNSEVEARRVLASGEGR